MLSSVDRDLIWLFMVILFGWVSQATPACKPGPLERPAPIEHWSGNRLDAGAARVSVQSPMAGRQLPHFHSAPSPKPMRNPSPRAAWSSPQPQHSRQMGDYQPPQSSARQAVPHSPMRTPQEPNRMCAQSPVQPVQPQQPAAGGQNHPMQPHAQPMNQSAAPSPLSHAGGHFEYQPQQQQAVRQSPLKRNAQADFEEAEAESSPTKKSRQAAQAAQAAEDWSGQVQLMDTTTRSDTLRSPMGGLHSQALEQSGWQTQNAPDGLRKRKANEDVEQA